MKQFKPTEKIIGENKFYIRPFPAFTAMRITGDLSNAVAPAMASLAPLVVKYISDKKVLDTDISELAPSMSGAFSGISGDKLENLSRELLTAYGNISVSPGCDDTKNKLLEEKDANELFCGDLDEMFLLMLEVIKINFSGFFKKLAARYGLDGEAGETEETTQNTAPLT